MDLKMLEQHYLRALNGLFASLQAIKYKKTIDIDTKIEAIDAWLRHLNKMKRCLVFMKHNKTEPPKELL